MLLVYYYNFNIEKFLFNDVCVCCVLVFVIDCNVIVKFVMCGGEFFVGNFMLFGIVGFIVKFVFFMDLVIVCKFFVEVGFFGGKGFL